MRRGGSRRPTIRGPGPLEADRRGRFAVEVQQVAERNLLFATRPQPARDLRAGSARSEEVALRLITARGGEQLPRLAVLDAFGRDLQAEVVAEVDRRVHDHRVA